MSLFGAMTSGVSALSAQSGAMGAIADNIANVNTVGYKNAKVAFQTLVTKQASPTMYSAGGVQARPRSAIDVQGLLQPTVSETDLAISGDGFFVVNAASQPTDRDQFLFTRAGSFTKDSDGFLRNTAGYYLQAWPTNAAGEVILPPGSDAVLTNKNVISPDFLQTVDLNRVAVNARRPARSRSAPTFRPTRMSATSMRSTFAPMTPSATLTPSPSPSSRPGPTSGI